MSQQKGQGPRSKNENATDTVAFFVYELDWCGYYFASIFSVANERE